MNAPSKENDIITGLQKTVSASRLSLFLQCRLKFYFRYVLSLQKPKSPALHLGNSVHIVLKAWNKARWINKTLTLGQLHEVYDKAWADQIDDPVKWDDDEDEAKLSGWRLCDTYLRETPIPLNTKPDAVEVSIEAELNGIKLIGVLDLVQQKQIIDYKTSSTTPHPEKVQHTTEIQTSTYAILYRHNTGHREHGIQLHHLVKLKNPKVVITSLPAMNDQQESRLLHLIDAYQEGLDRKDFVPSPGMQCHSCEFFHECRKWK